ncbi:hypothetical protein OPT61_g4445 [Boeremia exigua]|uniref:Uncharacterized protein n=1 Tax=Boeremia exigua TaxID=749465 RepID=A0ACC2IE83_9PLEO|nr:hypothetical protein OPT61_g4445 [Boeremia exigua]
MICGWDSEGGNISSTIGDCLWEWAILLPRAFLTNALRAVLQPQQNPRKGESKYEEHKEEIPASSFGALPDGFKTPSSGVNAERSIWVDSAPAAAYNDSKGQYGVFINTVRGDTTPNGLAREAPFRILVQTSEGDLHVPDGKYTTVQYVQFEQLHQPSLSWLPVTNFQKRTTWMVGIASNLDMTTEPSSVHLGQWASHWGVYIVPKAVTLEEYPYRIYGLNFSNKHGKGGRDENTVLIVGHNWKTTRGYVKKIDASEFERVTEPKEMHFAHDEFVLTARYLLMKFHEQQDGYRHIKQMDAKAYSLVANNCHTFANQILHHMIAEKWTNPHRLDDEDIPTWPRRLEHNVLARCADGGLMESLESQPLKQRKEGLHYGLECGAKYKLYFNLLQAKIDEYNVEVEDTYNIDKKRFLISITTRTKHVFSRRLAWLKQVFNRFTKAKARRKYRLLILNSHGSYVTMDFINYSPLQPNVILQRFEKPSPEASDSNSSSNSVYSGKGWLKIETLLRKVAKDEGSKELRKISCLLYHISIQNSLLHHKIAGLKEVLKTQKKHKNKSKTLDLQQKKWAQGGAVFWSPRKVEEARQREKTKQQEQRAEELRKAEMAELRKANKLYKEKIAEENRVRRAREKEEREQAKAQKAAEEAERKAIKERDKQLQNAQKAIQLSQRGRGRPLKAAAAKKKPARRGVGARRAPKPATPPPPSRTHKTRSGRTATLYN